VRGGGVDIRTTRSRERPGTVPIDPESRKTEDWTEVEELDVD
jgi:hypothetical protein